METTHQWVSIDPGTHVGVVYWRGVEVVRSECYHCGRMPLDMVQRCERVAEAVWEWVGTGGVVVCEDFLLRGRIGSTDREGLSPVQTTFSVLTYLVSYGWVGELVMQGVTDAKAVITDDRLRKLGGWVGNAHQRDAMRHGLLYLRRVRSSGR